MRSQLVNLDTRPIVVVIVSLAVILTAGVTRAVRHVTSAMFASILIHLIPMVPNAGIAVIIFRTA